MLIPSFSANPTKDIPDLEQTAFEKFIYEYDAYL